MQAIRILTGCRASGRGYAAGEIYGVPDGIGADDAALLVRLGRAEATVLPDKHSEAAQPAEKKSGRSRR